jgi:hypothetical protein
MDLGIPLVVIPKRPKRAYMCILNNAVDAVTSAVHWIYNLLITRQLRRFYFDTWRGTESPLDGCTRLSPDTDSDMWRSSPENIAYCKALMERKFNAWDSGVMTIIYFALLTFFLLKLLRFCWNLGAPGRGQQHTCTCEHARGGEYRTVDVEELRRLLREERGEEKTAPAIKQHE